MATPATQTSSPIQVIQNYSPIMVPINPNMNNYPLGAGFDPITLAVSAQQLDVPSPASLPTTPTNHYGPTLESIASQSAFSSAFNFEASFVGSGGGGALSGSAAASYAETQQISSSSIALLSNFIQITGAYTMDQNSNPPANTWAPSETAVNNLIDAINNAGGYEQFVQTNGANFVGGYIYGYTFFGSYVAEFETFQDAINANAKLSGSYSGAGSGEINANLQSDMQTQTGYQRSTPNSGGTYSPNPPVTSIDTLNQAVTSLSSGNIPSQALYAITYDWRAIQAVGQQFSDGFNAGNFQANLAALTPIQQQLSYAQGTQQSLENGQDMFPVGTTSTQNIQAIGTTLQNLAGQIEALTYTELSVSPSPTPSFITDLQSGVESANAQCLNIANGQANFQIVLSLGDDRWGPPGQCSPGVNLKKGIYTVPQIQPAGGEAPTPTPLPDYYVSVPRTPQGKWSKNAGDNQTWYFGFTYYSVDQSQSNPEPTLVVSVGLVQNGAYNQAWVATDSTGTSIPNGYSWVAQNPSDWPTTVPCSITVTLI